MYVVCNKVNFITNITNSTRIHKFYFYNNKHTFINMDTTFTIKYTNLIKINTKSVAGPKCSPEIRLDKMIGLSQSVCYLAVSKTLTRNI